VRAISCAGAVFFVCLGHATKWDAQGSPTTDVNIISVEMTLIIIYNSVPGASANRMNEPFLPPFYLKSTFAQTFLSSSSIRKWGANPMLAAAQQVILDTVAGIRLQGFYSPQSAGQAKGVVMLLHGWEGSANSAYILGTGRYLYNQGYSVFRVNYRDHGETHHLNSGLFYAVLLEEVFQAVQQVAGYTPALPFTIVGFSLGGNFALRIARRCVQTPIANLAHVFSISPALNPEKSTSAIDNNPLLRKYFQQKWARSLIKKQALFPDLYDFKDVIALDSIAEMTEVMVQRYSDFNNSKDYFQGYAVLGNALRELTTPTTIITSQDDPIIPVEDFLNLKRNQLTSLIIHPYGGHNGFLETIAGRTWYERKILETLNGVSE
jgi:predicted alpha/beta-fold hydrolase